MIDIKPVNQCMSHSNHGMQSCVLGEEQRALKDWWLHAVADQLSLQLVVRCASMAGIIAKDGAAAQPTIAEGVAWFTAQGLDMASVACIQPWLPI